MKPIVSAVSGLFVAVLLLFCLKACNVEVLQFGENKNESGSQEQATSQEEKPAQDASTAPENSSNEEPAEKEAPIGYRQLHQPCEWYESAPLTKRCVKGLRCVRLEGVDAVCLQDCSENPNLCLANKASQRTQCRHIAWTQNKPRQPVSVCVKEVALNESCGLEKSVLCAKTRANHRVCRLGKCLEAKLVKRENAPCGLFLPQPAECDLASGLTCSGLRNNTCQRGVAALEGSICDRFERYCGPGFLCSSLDVTGKIPSICLLQCDPKQPQETACPKRPGFTCVPGNVSGACVQLGCGTYRECYYQDPPNQCTTVRSQQGETTACTPALPGTQKLGQPCNQDSKRCEYPLLCSHTTEAATDSICVPPCRTKKDCGDFEQRLVCIQSKLCVWRCAADSDCPMEGMKCIVEKGICSNPNP